MNIKAADLICLIMITAAFIFATVMYFSLPEQIPLHWDAAGEIDGYGSKSYAFMFPVIAAVVWLLMLFTRRFSPKGYTVDSFIRTVCIFQVVLVALMVAIGVMILLAANGQQFDMLAVMGVTMGLVFFVLGNFMGRVRPNFFIGIRTPWTLANEEVWTRTHRLAAWMLTLAGLYMMVASLAGLSLVTSIIVVAVAAIAPAIYSFIIYRRLEGFS